MTSWQQFEQQAPELAAAAKARFTAHQHLTMATVRADGSPRICGTEMPIVGGEAWLGGMTGNRRFADLRREPRVGVHSAPEDPDRWTGDARLTARAVEITDPAEQDRFRAGAPQVPDGPFELFRLELLEVTTVELTNGGDHLKISTWRPGQPVREVLRR